MAVIGRGPEAQQQAPTDDFYQFCKDLGLIRSQDLDEQLSVGSGFADPEDLHMLHDVNDLYGKLSNNSYDAGDAFDTQEASSILESLWGPEHLAHTPAGGCCNHSSHPEGTCPPQQQQQQTLSGTGVPRAPSQGNFLHPHRAVVTAMPFMPGSPSAAMVANGLKDPGAIAAAAAVAAPGAAEDDDRRSVDTLPMPHKRRRLNGGGQEASSRPSPNDRAYLPTTSSGAVAGTGSTATAAAARPPRSSPQQQPAALPQGMVPVANNNQGGAGEPVKAVLVSKVLTKSDASSKRIILPRIAVEANLPQVTQGGGKTFYFDATDPSGASWPLCIKAWANGQNPKPVYVLEQVGDLLKQHKLGVGDAVAVLASRSGAFFIEWNTELAHSAAARPTYSAFTFSTAAAAAGSAAPQQQPEEPKQQQQQQEGGQTSPAAAAVPESVDNTATQQQQPAGSAAAPAASPFASAAAPQQQQQQQASPAASAAPAAASNVNGGWYSNMPADLLVCERVGPVDPFDRPPHPRAADAFLTIDDSQPSLPLEGAALAAAVAAAGGAAAAAGGGGTKVSAAELLQRHEADLQAVMVDGDVVEGEGGALHQGGYLVCPRTPGCTRPAGHQGWCVGHKGFKKRGRNGNA